MTDDNWLAALLIELLNEHCDHGYAKTIDGKLYHCISGPELLAIAEALLLAKNPNKGVPTVQCGKCGVTGLRHDESCWGCGEVYG